MGHRSDIYRASYVNKSNIVTDSWITFIYSLSVMTFHHFLYHEYVCLYTILYIFMFIYYYICFVLTKHLILVYVLLCIVISQCVNYIIAFI